MKKALSMILVLTMVLALALPAMAADGDPITTAPTESSKDVTASYTGESHTVKEGDVLYFTITWTPTAPETALAYTGEQATYTWDGASMKYNKNTSTDDGYVAAGWNDGTAGYTITVTNQSNIALTVVNTASVKHGLTVTEKVGNGDAKTPDEKGTTTTLNSAAEGVGFGKDDKGTAQSVSILYTYAKGTNSTAPGSDDILTDGKSATVGTLKVVVSTYTA